MTIAFRRIMLPRYHEKMFTGASVTTMVEVIDSNVIDVLLEPSSLPLISIYDPLSVQKVFDAEMTHVSTGVYKYNYRIPFVSPLGVYTGNFSALSNENVARIDRISLFKVIRLSLFYDVSYLVMRDQAGNLWYLYIDIAGQIVTQPTVPSFLVKDAVDLNVVPAYWITLTNGLSLTRYIYPDITGSLVVSPTQPPIGTGIANPALWIGENGLNYVLSLDIIDDIITLEV